MEVAILYCGECFFSQRAQAQLNKALEAMAGNDSQKLSLAVRTYEIKEIETQEKVAEVQRAKAQIIILSQHFLDRLKHEATVRNKVSPVNKILRAKRAIAVLLSLSAAEVNDGFQQYLGRFQDWYSIELKSSNKLDPEFYKKFNEQIVKIYNVELSNTATFSIFPKKISKDQSKVVILFKNEVRPADRVHLELTRGRQKEQLEEVMMSNPHAGMIRVPSSLCGDRTSLVEISVFINNQKLGTKLVKYDQGMKSSEEDVLDRISQAVPGFRKALDDHISQQLSRNFRLCEDFTLDSSLELMNDVLICRSEDFPTLLHFGANYGLEQMICVLLYEGDGLEHTTVKNDVGETPVDIAIERGFPAIAQTIKDFSEMSNTFGALQFIKDLCDREEELGLSPENPMDSENKGTAEDEMRNRALEHSGEDEFQQSNLEYILLDGDCEAEVAGNEPITILVDSSLDEDSNEYAREETKLRHHSFHLHVPRPNYRRDQIETQDYVNVNTESGQLSDSLDQKFLLLQSYDVPPPPVMLKPPLKIGSLPHLVTGGNEYDLPRTSWDDYCIPTGGRPVLAEKPSLNSVQPSDPVLSIKSNLIHSSDGYILMNNEEKEEDEQKTKSSPTPPLKPIRVKPPPVNGSHVHPPLVSFPTAGLSKKGFLKTASASPLPLTKQFSLDPTQEELLELMNDFKKNVYNIRELELLYENWKQRHDVQNDYKMRQKELREIQKEYKKIQEKIRRDSKKPGPLNKLLKLMPGSRKKHSIPNMDQNPGSSLPPETQLEQVQAERKVSGCSDRCSSGSSVPDSGVSDPDSEKDRLRSSYYVEACVLPSGTQNGAQGTMNLGAEPAAVLPSRPPKKPSVCSDPPSIPGATPPRSLKTSTEKPPLELPMAVPVLEKVPAIPAKKQSVVEEMAFNNSTPPQPPPRVMKFASPFSYIDYKGKGRGLMGMGHGPSVEKSSGLTQTVVGAPAGTRVKSTYENGAEGHKN